jgi:Tol biopolymer transport system component
VERSQIYTVPVSGGKAQQITHEDTGAFSPMWSSDGQHIIFYSDGRLSRIPAAGGAIEPEKVILVA